MKGDKVLYLCVVLVLLFLTILFPVIDVDSAKYAAISMEMWHSGSFLEVYDAGRDYLDKPPLLFWLSSIFIGVFDHSAWAYKLASYLLLGFGIWRFVRFLYREKEEQWEFLLMLLSSFGFFYLILDVKTEPLLLSGMLIVVPSIHCLFKRFSYRELMLTAVGIAIGMLSKGIITLVVLGAYSVPLIFSFPKQVLKLRWLMILLIVLILISPMLYGLYTQFDLYPEKLVNGKTEVSGLRFYFWEQNFGRITGENTWKNNYRPFFLVNSLLLFAIPFIQYALYYVFHLFKRRAWHLQDQCMLCAIIIVLFLLSFSHYKLPHYSYTVFFFFIYLAFQGHLLVKQQNPKWIFILDTILMSTFLLLSGIIMIWFWDGLWQGVLAIFTLGSVVYSLTFRHQASMQKVATSSLALMIMFMIYIAPIIRTYQPDNQLLHIINRKDIHTSQLAFFNRESDAIDFALCTRLPRYKYEDMLTLLQNKDKRSFYMAQDGLDHMISHGHHPTEIDTMYYYDINRVKPKFFIRDKKESFCETRFLVRFYDGHK